VLLSPYERARALGVALYLYRYGPSVAGDDSFSASEVGSAVKAGYVRRMSSSEGHPWCWQLSDDGRSVCRAAVASTCLTG
jgi:hypothetical protein